MRHHFHALARALALDRQPKRRLGPRLHQRDQTIPALDRLAVGRDHAIARHQSRALRCAAAHHLADHRLERRPEKPQAYALERIALHVIRRERAQIERRIAQMAALVQHLQSQRLALQRRLQHAPAQFLPGGDRLAVHRAHRVAGAQAGVCGHAAFERRADDRACFGQAVHEQARIHRDGEQEVGHRSGHYDRKAPPYALAVERAVRLVRLDRAFALIEHLHVAAEGDRRDDPLGLIFAPAPSGERTAKTYGEAEHLYVAKARD